MEAFNDSAAFYDALFDEHTRLEREGPLLLELLERAPCNRVADIACGTGPHALFLANTGALVDAFDLSASMLERARAVRSHPNIRYARGDMCALEGGLWGLALCLGNSLSLLADFDAVSRVFARVFACLAPGGLFLTQVLNYSDTPRHTVIRKQRDGADITAVKSLVPGGTRTLLSLAFFAERGGENNSVAESAFLLPITPESQRQAAEDAGFFVESHYGSFGKGIFSPGVSSDSIIVFCKKIVSEHS